MSSTEPTREPLTEVQIAHANQLLTFLEAHARPGWSDVITEQFTGTELEQATKAVHSAMAMTNREPIGAYVGGTGAAKLGAGLTGEGAQIAVQALKSNTRMVQLGRGRGKVLVLIDVAKLGADATVALPKRSAPVKRARRGRPPVKATTRERQRTPNNRALLRRVKLLEDDVATLKGAMADSASAITWDS